MSGISENGIWKHWNLNGFTSNKKLPKITLDQSGEGTRRLTVNSKKKLQLS